MKAMIFAAGLGTRLAPLTNTMPKALVPINGKPLLYHVINSLVSYGFDSFVVNVHHFANQIVNYLNDNNFNSTILISDESSQLLNTGGGILHAENLLLDSDRFLVHNVDIFSNLKISEFVDCFPDDALAMIVVSERKTSRYLIFDENNLLVGWTNIQTGEVRTPYISLNISKCRLLAFSGIHLISNHIFEIMKSWASRPDFSIIDFYVENCNRHKIYAYIPNNFKMIDVGKIGIIKEAETFINLL